MKRLVICLALVLTGCATKPIPIAYDCPKIELPSDPIPLTNKLTEKSTPDEVVKAWVATAVAYHRWIITARTQIENSR